MLKDVFHKIRSRLVWRLNTNNTVMIKNEWNMWVFHHVVIWHIKGKAPTHTRTHTKIHTLIYQSPFIRQYSHTHVVFPSSKCVSSVCFCNFCPTKDSLMGHKNAVSVKEYQLSHPSGSGLWAGDSRWVCQMFHVKLHRGCWIIRNDDSADVYTAVYCGWRDLSIYLCTYVWIEGNLLLLFIIRTWNGRG